MNPLSHTSYPSSIAMEAPVKSIPDSEITPANSLNRRAPCNDRFSSVHRGTRQANFMALRTDSKTFCWRRCIRSMRSMLESTLAAAPPPPPELTEPLTEPEVTRNSTSNCGGQSTFTLSTGLEAWNSIGGADGSSSHDTITVNPNRRFPSFEISRSRRRSKRYPAQRTNRWLAVSDRWSCQSPLTLSASRTRGVSSRARACQ
mmetsp:Transcript_16841/g.30532  ORF Transcript_16841/g.30532 Transcript_16841/m.30532 type:complete len:202 (+) Transcript_16841:103-708(+)